MSVNTMFPATRAQVNKPREQKALEAIENTIASAGATISNEAVTKIALGLETHDEAVTSGTVEKVQDAVDQFVDTLKDNEHGAAEEEAFEQFIYGVDGSIVDKVERFNREAAMNVSTAFGNPSLYHQHAVTTESALGKDVVGVDPFTGGSFGSIPVFNQPVESLESYDQSALNNFRSMSVAFNGGGARQNAFGENFWTTTVVGADQTGVEISIRPTMVMKDVRHGNTGDPMSFGRVRLLDAIRDPDILASNMTELVPFINPDTEDKFYTEDSVSLPAATVEQHSIPTGFIKTGINVDLLALSNHPGLLDNGVLDKSDAIDPPLMVGKILLKIASKDGSKVEYFSVDTKMHHGNTFQYPTEGRGRDQLLNFRFKAMNFGPGTKLHGGAESEVFKAAFDAGWSIGLQGSLSGLADLERGNVEINPGTVKISSLRNSDGPIATDIDSGKVFVDSVGKIEIVGWYPDGNRSNLNLRQRGTLLTYVEERYRYTVPLQAPIAIIKPTSYNTGDTADLKALTEAVRVRNSNNAVTQLFNYADHLEQVVNVQRDLGNLYGIGGKVVEPYFKHIELDLAKVITSMQSSTRALDVHSVLMDRLHDEIHEALAESNYLAVLEHTDLGSGTKPVVAVGTDQQTIRHLTVVGDRRATQLGYEMRIAATNDKRMRYYEENSEGNMEDVGEMFISFKRPSISPNGLDPLDFGRMLWVPELVTVIPSMVRGGQASKELIVQPRVIHVPTLPIMIRVTVRNLRKVIQEAHNPNS